MELLFIALNEKLNDSSGTAFQNSFSILFPTLPEQNREMRLAPEMERFF